MANSEWLTVSSLRALLSDLEREHGDIPVVVEDADTWWFFKLKEGHLIKIDDDPWLQISIDYHDEKADTE